MRIWVPDLSGENKMYVCESFRMDKIQYKIVKLQSIPPINFVKIGSHNNAVVKLNGLNLRYRCEVLVLNENKDEVYLYMMENEDGSYYVPGGGAEPNKTMEEQVAAETREEAGFEIKDLKHAGIQFIKIFNGEIPDWHKEHLHPNGLYYDGYLTELFIAIYDGPIKKEVTNKKDIDQNMRNNGKFYNINQMVGTLRKEHIAALEIARKK